MRTFFMMITASILIAACGPIPLSERENILVNQRLVTAIERKQPIPHNFIPRDITVVAIGDSLTKGVGDSTSQGGYIPYLKDLLEEEKGIKQATIYNYGVKGNRSSQLLKRLDSKKIKDTVRTADLVIITIGGNDVMKVVKNHISHLKKEYFEQEQQLFQQNIKNIISKIKTVNPTTNILLVGLYNPFSSWMGDLDEMNQILSNWNETSQLIINQYENVHYIKINDIFLEGGEELLYSDYFHPNDKGYKLIADRLFESLNNQIITDG